MEPTPTGWSTKVSEEALLPMNRDVVVSHHGYNAYHKPLGLRVALLLLY